MPRKRYKLPPKPSLERIQAMLARRRWDYVPPQASPSAEPKPSPLPESAGDAYRRVVGLPSADGCASDTAKPDERYPRAYADSPIPGTERPGEHYLDHQNRILQEIGFQAVGGFQNRRSPAEIARDQQAAANRERILALFKTTPYAGDLLPNGKILYDCREMTPEQWERERFRTS